MKDGTPEYVKWFFTVIGLGVAGYALVYREFGYALPFVVIALVPWCDFESLTLLGTGIRFRKQLQQVEKTLKVADIPESKMKKKQVGAAISTDPTTLMAKQKHDIEEKVRMLSAKHDIELKYNEPDTVVKFLEELEEAGIMDRKESTATLQTMSLLNRSVHEIKLTQDEIERAVSVGSSIISLLNSRLYAH